MSTPPAVIIGSIARVMPERAGPPAGGAVVRDLGILVVGAPDPVPDEGPDDREPGLLDDPLDRGGDVADPVVHLGLLDPGCERRLADLEQPLGLGGHLADCERVRGVRDVAVECDAHVERQQVTVGDLVRARDPVDDHVVRRDADRLREPAIALRRRDPPVRVDELLGDAVELFGRHAGLDVTADVRDRVGGYTSGGRDQLDLAL